MRRLSPFFALIALLAVLAIGVPIFIRMPVWVDVTYHDLSAWNIIHGGLHYRDVFETNLPGMVWLHALIRPLIGWSHEAIRIVDLAIVTVILFALASPGESGRRRSLAGDALVPGCRLSVLFVRDRVHPLPARRLDAAAGRAGDVASRRRQVSGNRLGECARCECAGHAARSRRRRRSGSPSLLRRATESPAAFFAAKRKRGIVAGARPILWSIVEGMLWGLAIWIKPHVLVPALAAWIISLRFQTRRAAIVDAIALLFGGAIVGGVGSYWLIRTGAWQPMWDILLNWNQEYYSWSWDNLYHKVQLVSGYFAPFSLLHFAAVPFAVYALIRRQPRLRDPRRRLPRVAGAGNGDSEGIRLRACAADVARPGRAGVVSLAGRADLPGVVRRGRLDSDLCKRIGMAGAVQAAVPDRDASDRTASSNRPRRSAGALASLLARRFVGIERRTHLLSAHALRAELERVAAGGRFSGDEEPARSRADLLARFDAPALRLARDQAGDSLSARHHGDEVQVEARTDSRRDVREPGTLCGQRPGADRVHSHVRPGAARGPGKRRCRRSFRNGARTCIRGTNRSFSAPDATLSTK